MQLSGKEAKSFDQIDQGSSLFIFLKGECVNENDYCSG